MRINLIVLGFAPMYRLSRESLAQDKGNPVLITEVGQPLPREDTLAADAYVRAIGSKDAQKRFGGRRQIFLDQLRATLIEDTDGHGLRLEINPTIRGMLLRVEIQPGVLL